MSQTCHSMKEGEVLNASHGNYPLFEAVLYGDRVSTAKLSKRLGCAIKHLPIRVRFTFEYDTQKAVEQGIAKDPTLVLDGKIFLEGLPEAEHMTNVFKNILRNSIP